MSKTFNKS